MTDKRITEFLLYLEKKKGRSTKTVRNYHLYLTRFDSWRERKDIKLEDLLITDLLEYKKSLNFLQDRFSKRTLQESTKNYHLIALREFLRFLNKKKIIKIAVNSLKLGKKDSSKNKQNGSFNVDQLLEAPQKFSKTEILGLRDRAILEVLFSTGIKVSEIVNLQITDFLWKKDLKVIKVKGKIKREIPLHNQTAFWLNKYLEKRDDRSPFLFLSHDRAKFGEKRLEVKALTARTVERVVEKYKNLIGCEKKITPGSFRAYFARKRLKDGLGDKEFLKIMGTKSKNSIQSYL